MKFFEIKNQSDQSAEIYIFGDIVDDSWNWGWEDDPNIYPKNIQKMLADLKGKNLTIHINSGGGHVFAGTAIANMIKNHDGTTTAIVDGLAGSIASVIAFACDKIQIPENAYLMIHKPSCSVWGDSDTLLKAAEMLEVLQEGIINSYMKHTQEGVTKDQIKDLVNQETWFTGEQAKEYFNIETTDQMELVACSGEFFDRLKRPKDIKNSTDRQTEQNLQSQKIKEIEIEMAMI